MKSKLIWLPILMIAITHEPLRAPGINSWKKNKFRQCRKWCVLRLFALNRRRRRRSGWVTQAAKATVA